jgi:FkbM family methyltransferase
MKEFLKRIPFLRAGVRNTRQFWRDWRNNPKRWIASALRDDTNACVVQIGSNDGMTQDPFHSLLLRHSGWSALLVEPVPFLFDRLKKNYPSESRFQFADVAVGASDGSMPFYYVAPEARTALPHLPPWFDQLGSFNREHITSHFQGADIRPFIVETSVPTTTLASLFKRHHICQISALHIDTEGHDWIVLQQLDLKQYSPKVILFEHNHLTAAAKAAAIAMLQPDYDLTDLGRDYFCRLK